MPVVIEKKEIYFENGKKRNFIISVFTWYIIFSSLLQSVSPKFISIFSLDFSISFIVIEFWGPFVILSLKNGVVRTEHP